MYQIGEFSQITRFTVKALRYYDQEGILTPSGRSESGYRLYSQEDFQTAQRIALLRESGFSIAELREALPQCQDDGDLRCFLEQKQEQLTREIRKKRAAVRDIDRRLTTLERSYQHMNEYTVSIREFPAVRVASVRTRAPYAQTSGNFSALYKAVKGGGAGMPFNLYYDGEHADPADMESCVPLKPGFTPTGVEVRELPAVRAVCTLHVGPYQELNLAYKALLDYAEREGLELALPSREYYQKGPGPLFKGNPEKYETLVTIPLKSSM